ncbi:MAG: ferredoxin [Candidatus Enterosoma sp.]|nr:ferredoxin [bacterium]MDY5649886.1 ferredoxin [Candidatus Enterosoma sp.]MDY5865687.1 ferredoxin [Candidatus Enterosoma sp.]
MAKKVVINKDDCFGCGACTATCPEVFQMEDDGKAGVVAQPSDELDAAVEDAVNGCPVGAIKAE